jgi:hypothetical protein
MSVIDSRPATPKEATQASYLICANYGGELFYPDNVVTSCCACRRMLQHRPDVPKGPTPICFPCIVAMQSQTRH